MIKLVASLLLIGLFVTVETSTTQEENNKPNNCTCVPYYQCSEDTGNVITSGAGLFDLRNFEDETCTGYFDVCCNVPLDTDKIVFEKEEQPKGCGFHSPGKFPWSVILRQRKYPKETFHHKCGASLIHPQVAITAAHCIDRNENYELKIGNQSSLVSKVIHHPKFNLNTLQNDLTILILKNSMKISEDVSIVCIPSPRYVPVNIQCITSSWNHTGEHEDEPVRKLLKLPIISKRTCENTMRATRLGKFFQLHKSFVCAGGEVQKDTCNGDGGNPLVCPIPGERGRYHQVGIVSWGIGCGEFNLPGIYVNTNIFRDWIDKIMIKNGFDINSYRN